MKNQEKANRENTRDDSSKASETPFFARFLEGQHIETTTGAPNDGASFQTLKYPSDRDEDIDPFSRV
ncbi:MAG TPA: microviridin/marinostatin family tricyclic proteinase inhibitor [Pyrinomonadaceae bacterium]|nr:microviridin/marinostatin family tricyclic proteinase inhibitor [Pyrinomonadaceae bacterium]